MILEQKKCSKKNKYTIEILLACFYIFTSYIANRLMLSPVVNSLALYAFVAWVLFSTILSGRVTITSFSMWYFLVLAFAVCSLLWAPHAEVSAVYNMLVALVLSFCFIRTIDTEEKLNLCATVYVWSCNLMGVLIFALDLVSEEERLGEAITGNANSFSAMLMIACVLAFWKCLYAQKTIFKLLFLFSGIFQLILMMYSGGRKTVLAVLVCFVWFFISRDFKHLLPFLRNVLIAAALIFVFFYIAMENPKMYELIGSRFEGLFDLFLGNESSVSSDATRIQMVTIGLQKWLRSPIWGYGVDSFKYYNREVTGLFYYAHNNYVELLYDLGLIGFALYYSIFAKLLKKIRRCWNENVSCCSLASGLIFMLLVFDIGGVSFHSPFVVCILCLVYIASNLRESGENLTPNASGKHLV